MATRVGTGVTGQGDGASATLAAAAKATTTGNLLTAFVKWEFSSVPLTGLADTAGNTWVVVAALEHGNGTLRGALGYAANITGHAANVVTATFGTGTAEWRRIIVEEWAGLALTSVADGNAVTALGAGSPFDTAAITTTIAGLVVLGVAGYGTLTSVAGAGSPTFTVGLTVSDTTFGYLLSASAQSVTPRITASGGDGADISIAQALKNAAGGVAFVPRPGMLYAQAVRRAATF